MAYDFKGAGPALRPRCCGEWVGGLLRATRDLVRTLDGRVVVGNARTVDSEGWCPGGGYDAGCTPCSGGDFLGALFDPTLVGMRREMCREAAGVGVGVRKAGAGMTKIE